MFRLSPDDDRRSVQRTNSASTRRSHRVGRSLDMTTAATTLIALGVAVRLR